MRTIPRMTCAKQAGLLSLSTHTGFTWKQAAGSVCAPGARVLARTQAERGRGGVLDLQVRQLSDHAVTLRQTFRNTSARMLRVSDLVLLDGRLELEGAGWRVAHCELFKRERYFQGYGTTTGNFFAPLPGFEGEFGISEDWPFPGLFITHPERGTVLLAALSQERFKPVWALHGSGRGVRLQAREAFTGVPSLPLKAGETLCGEEWLLLFDPRGIEEATDQYYALLRKRLPFRGATSPLRQAVVWGSWNYNTRPRGFADITHAMVLDNARALRRLVPAGKPVVAMIDDGYQFGRSRIPDMRDWFSSCLEIFHDDGNPPHDPALFPEGMGGITSALHGIGVTPALWTTIRLHRESSLARDRPEWLLQTADGKGFGRRTAYLDYSLPEVRVFMRQVWKTIFGTWGFRGLKLDFWSLAFEIPQIRYRNRERTAVEWRNLFLQDLRDSMPPDAFLLLCVVCNGGGSPFVGRYADAARMGADIGSGSVNDIRQAAHGLTTAIPFYRHDALLGDPDSIGWHDASAPGLNRLWNTTALLAGGMCEIGGDLTALSADAEACLRTAAQVHAPRLVTRNGVNYPGLGGAPSERLVARFEKGTYVGELNWTSMPREIRLSAPGRDLWTGQRLKDRCKIPPYDAVCYRLAHG